MDKARLHYRVVSLMDARFSPDSPLARLTGRQREILTKAYELGYYDRPRRISSDELASRLNIAKSTLVAHRRKAERRLLAEILSDR
jgi:predicted DNA binding protein